MIDSYFLKTVPKFNLDVSRETLERLDEYSKDIILKNKEINLISKTTDVIFNALHGNEGEDGIAQSYFEYLKIILFPHRII